MNIPFPLFSPHLSFASLDSARLSFATPGFFFLIPREVALGLWLFPLLNDLQDTVYREIGWGIEQWPALSGWSRKGLSSLVHQSLGAMIVLVLGGLWVGREHTWNVCRKAFGWAPEVEDGDEIVSYRGALFGLLASVGVMGLWLWGAGIPPVGVLIFLFFMFVVFVALTRVIAEGGVAYLHTPMMIADASVVAGGTSVFGASGLVGLMFTRVLGNDLLNFAMPHAANGLKLAGEIQGRRRALFWGMLLAILLALAGGIWMLLQLAYTFGAINLRQTHFVWLPNFVGDYTAARIINPSEPYWRGWFHSGIGSIAMLLLMLARRYWSWWPLHPIGFPISSAFRWFAFNAFLAWLFKGLILRYGGVALYRRIRPFFLGLILGQFTIYGVFWILDTCSGMTGNRFPFAW